MFFELPSATLLRQPNFACDLYYIIYLALFLCWLPFGLKLDIACLQPPNLPAIPLVQVSIFFIFLCWTFSLQAPHDRRARSASATWRALPGWPWRRLSELSFLFFCAQRFYVQASPQCQPGTHAAGCWKHDDAWAYSATAMRPPPSPRSDTTGGSTWRAWA